MGGMNLIYVADPMCSWCYGFGRTMDELLDDPREAAPLQLALVMGGLRPYTEEALAPERVEELMGHWQHVHEASGQPFDTGPDVAMRQPGFVYDTEPASRAIVTVRALAPRLMWRYFKSVQEAFYAQGLDVTRPEVLADLAGLLGLPRADFAQAFASDAMRLAVRRDFEQARQWGIRGFPTLVAEHGEQLHLVCQGYALADLIHERFAALLREGD
jgi:putative protein-disulfide isomerase